MRIATVVGLPETGADLLSLLLSNYIELLVNFSSSGSHRRSEAVAGQQGGFIEAGVLPAQDARVRVNSYREAIDFTEDAGPEEGFADPAIFLVRNPLDYLGARHGADVLELGSGSGCWRIRDACAVSLHEIAGAYKFHRKRRALLLHYENLLERPSTTLKRAAEHCRLPVDPRLIEQAIAHTPSLESSQPIGQWSKSLAACATKLIRSRVEDSGLPWSRFIFAPRMRDAERSAYIRAIKLLHGVPYAETYSGEVGRFIAERKSAVARSWERDRSFSVRTAGRDYEATPDFQNLTRLFLATVPAFDRVVEIGCGDGQYLEHLKTKAPGVREWIATDIDSPRLTAVKADIIECMRWNEHRTLYISANVFGNIAPDDLFRFFCSLKSTVVFLAGGLPPLDAASFALRENGIAFDHNFKRLIEESGLVARSLEYDGKGGWWVIASAGGSTGLVTA